MTTWRQNAPLALMWDGNWYSKSSNLEKLKKKSAAKGNIHVFKKSLFSKKIVLQKWCCNQPKILVLVSKIWANLLFSNPFLNVLFWHWNDQIFWFFYPPILYPSHLTSFLRPDNLKIKLTVCSAVINAQNFVKSQLRSSTINLMSIPKSAK